VLPGSMSTHAIPPKEMEFNVCGLVGHFI
jgi:hypothetical protein